MLGFAVTLSSRLRTLRPEFEILRSIVVTYTIDVVHGFIRLHVSSELLFHHQPMFCDILAIRGIDNGVVVGQVYKDITPPHNLPALPPSCC